MKIILILVALGLFLCATSSAFQGGGGETTKKKAVAKKNSGTKSGNTTIAQEGRLDAWVKTNFPSGVDTFTANLAINSSGHIFAGTGNGIYRSTDNGNHWIQINDGLKYDSFGKLNIFALAINSGGHIFIAIYNELYRSTDNGNHWTKIKSGFTALALAVNSSGHIFAGAAADGVYCSTNNGATWTQINNGLINSNTGYSNVVNSIAINSDGDVFAGAYDGVYRSTDNGNHWTQKLNFDGGNSAHAFAINSSGNIFVGMDSNARADQGTEGVYHSTNNGDNWTRIIKNYGHQIKDFDGAWAILINSSGHIFLGTRSGVYRSTNNGGNWTKISKGLDLSKGSSDKNVSALAINPSGIIFAVTPAGVYRSK